MVYRCYGDIDCYCGFVCIFQCCDNNNSTNYFESCDITNGFCGELPTTFPITQDYLCSTNTNYSCILPWEAGLIAMITVMVLGLIIFGGWKLSEYYKHQKALRRSVELGRVPVEDLRQQMEVYNANFDDSTRTSIESFETLPDYGEFENSSGKVPGYNDEVVSSVGENTLNRTKISNSGENGMENNDISTPSSTFPTAPTFHTIKL